MHQPARIDVAKLTMTPPDPKLAPGGPPRILIVDDDAGQRSLLDSFLQSQGFETVTAASGEQALEVLSSVPVQMMISDVRMPGISGLETLRRARGDHTVLPVLMVTAYPDIRDAVGAIRGGAVNYLEKPIDLDELLATVRKVVGLEGEVTVKLGANKHLPDYIVAQSPFMQSVFRDASLVAASDSRILITGESGVGKEVVADVLHAWSPRAPHPFVKVNCAAIPENLLESELFGHEKGSFTGAYTQRIGRFEEADLGTILLDEIAELSPRLQAKLLRITQDGGFQRVGSNKERHTHTRLLAATNRNLEQAVQKGQFRNDLFYRLDVIELFVPPLRERRPDILPLASRFIAEFSNRRARFSPAVAACLENYRWPGNVRELRNAMERATLLCHGELILPEHLPMRIRQKVQEFEKAEPTPSPLEDLERHAIIQALRDNRFNRTETAKALGISRRTGPYRQIDRVLQANVPCAPCGKARCKAVKPCDCLRSILPGAVATQNPSAPESPASPALPNTNPPHGFPETAWERQCRRTHGRPLEDHPSRWSSVHGPARRPRRCEPTPVNR
ncbi:MAG: sigma 54-interacting transcriptional regulator [Candidatus Omnitrophica bacterium]|nr:sigma 54-interacting transcriptional regulator [Candidatus Omnitrophota bacterium]